jgi:hypothetical protein
VKTCPKCGYETPPRSFAPPSRQELKSGWLQIEISMRLAFSYYLWQKRYQPADDNSEDCKFMRAAVLECALLNIRIVDEFFRQQSWPSDIRAAQYPGFNNPGPFLSREEKRKLDQLVAHLTYRRLHEFDYTWKTFGLVRRAYTAFNKFLDYIQREFFRDQPNIKASIRLIKRRCETWLEEMQLWEVERR